MQQTETFSLGIAGFTYADLYQPERLSDLAQAFDSSLQQQNPELFQRFETYRKTKGNGTAKDVISALLIEVSSYLSAFVAKLFNVEQEWQKQQQQTQEEMATIFRFRSEVITNTKLAASFKKEPLSNEAATNAFKQIKQLLATQVSAELIERDLEKAVASLGMKLFEANQAEAEVQAAFCQTLTSLDFLLNTDTLEDVSDSSQVIAYLFNQLQAWCHWAAQQPGYNNWVLFKVPAKTDFTHLVHHALIDRDGYSAWCAEESDLRRRDGFKLTDPRFDGRHILYEVDHCIYCHDRETDSCAKGMKNKKDGSFKTNALGVTITGCPLEERISEMHYLKRQGDNLAALAMIMIDNPLCAGTGHRICNDCMKGCIYQKTESVNIPQIETNVLTDVLFMPYGLEIYSLFSRWNPLNIERPYMLPYNGKKVLVVGMGPAGYTLAHYLLNEGFAVVGIDGLKVEPLPEELASLTPIVDFKPHYEALNERVMLGFGGVAEYGITVRWDKNFLKVIYVLLARRHTFSIFGGIRFGGTVTVDDAWHLGFDHLAVAVGAGKPTIIDLKNNMLRGIRQASDFLMALQLTGAAKSTSLANLQVRLPAGVIGGGLTAIDTATELLAYYPVQVEKTLLRYEKLSAQIGEETLRNRYDQEELLILDEFLTHGKLIRAERERAEAAGEAPNFYPLLKEWGGVTLFYRKGMKDSPAYRQNHEEIHEALKEGIWLAEGMSPVEAVPDQYGHLQAVKFQKLEEIEGKWKTVAEVEIPLRGLFVAAGTSPNTIYESEYTNTFAMEYKFYRHYDWQQGELVENTEPLVIKAASPAPFTSYNANGKYITFYGDNHPLYAGNVVKAMTSAKHGYPFVRDLFADELAQLKAEQQGQRNQELQEFQNKLRQNFDATVVEVKRLTPTIIEVIVKAPLQAQRFEPGQFYRVQNYEQLAPKVEGTALATEGIALTGAWVDKEQGLISLIALEMGTSSRLCATWKKGDPIVVMGVTGAPTEIPQGHDVVLLGGGLGNAVLFSIGRALRAANCRVLYFAGYKNSQDCFKREDIEAAADVIIWTVDKQPKVQALEPRRAQDKSFVGNIIEAMIAYGKGELGEQPIPLNQIEHLIVIGSDRMMDAVKQARHSILQPYLKPNHIAIGSINSPMQCMMKGVCAQCLCKHVDPASGKEYFVYSCYNQDQELDYVDFPNLNARLRQNSVQEKLANRWLDYLLG